MSPELKSEILLKTTEVSLPKPRNGHERQPCLGDESYHASYPDSTATPLCDEISLPDVEDNKGECVNEG